MGALAIEHDLIPPVAQSTESLNHAENEFHERFSEVLQELSRYNIPACTNMLVCSFVDETTVSLEAGFPTDIYPVADSITFETGWSAIANAPLRPVMDTYLRKFAASTATAIKDSVETGYVTYTNESQEFLREHKDVSRMLSEIQMHLREYFPIESYALSVSTDPEEGDQWLVVTVETNQSVDVAMEKLDRFEDEYWLNVLPETNGRTCVTLGFL